MSSTVIVFGSEINLGKLLTPGNGACGRSFNPKKAQSSDSRKDQAYVLCLFNFNTNVFVCTVEDGKV